MRPQGGGIESANFFAWAHNFVQNVSDLTANDRYVLLTYDGYAVQLLLRVIDMFRANRIVAYALPAHTSGKLQPLDVVAFSVFRRELNKRDCEHVERERDWRNRHVILL